MNQQYRYTLLLTLLTLLLAACGGSSEAPPEATAVVPSADQATITLVANPWPSAELNAAVAKILIEQELGNPVEIIALDENLQWDALARGDADASLEVWPSGHGERIAQYIDQQNLVEHGGPLGPVGRIGWYVPAYVLALNPDLNSWEGFVDPENARLFATAETADKGRFLAGDPSWVQYDADIIRNLGLHLEVVTAGSEEALLAELSSNYNRQQPILFYFYEPHAIFSQFDLIQVALPEYSDACYEGAASGDVDCAYPDDELFKIFSPQLAQKDAAVHTLLRNLNYDNTAQIEMLAMVESGDSVETAAKNWIAGSEEIWRPWLNE